MRFRTIGILLNCAVCCLAAGLLILSLTADSSAPTNQQIQTPTAHASVSPGIAPIETNPRKLTCSFSEEDHLYVGGSARVYCKASRAITRLTISAPIRLLNSGKNQNGETLWFYDRPSKDYAHTSGLIQSDHFGRSVCPATKTCYGFVVWGVRPTPQSGYATLVVTAHIGNDKLSSTGFYQVFKDGFGDPA